MTRLRKICTAITILLAPSAAWCALSGPIILQSPGGTIVAHIATDRSGTLTYAILWNGQPLAPAAPIGVSVDGVRYGSAVTLGTPVFRQIDEQYPVIGVKTTATNRASEVSIPFRQGGAPAGVLEARAYDDGFAWRLHIDGKGPRLVTGEDSAWSLPAGKIWFPERNNPWKLKSYAGEYIAADVDKLPMISPQGPVQMAPLVLELASGGYELITEAALTNYSGMRLRAIGDRRLQVDFTEGERGFYVDGPVLTPWRVTMLARDLNTLVNSDLITNLNPPPDTKLFADTVYIRPGRSVWRWWSRQTGTALEEMQFADYASRLGFEYILVDDGWDDWPDHWQTMAQVCSYAHKHDVGVFAWKDYKYLSSPADNWLQLREFLDAAKAAGLAGLKIDFLNAESKDRIDFEYAALVFAAQRRLMIDFHGTHKPTGERRTYPNLISSEAVRGVELNKMAEGPVTPSHNAALPFTRFVAGPADYTPLSLSWPGATTWTHQVATAVLFTSPLLVIAEDPQLLLQSPDVNVALDLIKSIPSTWEETRVLPQSRIGDLAAMARRKGSVWYIALVAGSKSIDGSIDLASFASAPMHTEVLTSPEKRSFHEKVFVINSASPAFPYHLAAGDGMVIRLRP